MKKGLIKKKLFAPNYMTFTFLESSFYNFRWVDYSEIFGPFFLIRRVFRNQDPCGKDDRQLKAHSILSCIKAIQGETLSQWCTTQKFISQWDRIGYLPIRTFSVKF